MLKWPILTFESRSRQGNGNEMTSCAHFPHFSLKYTYYPKLAVSFFNSGEENLTSVSTAGQIKHCEARAWAEACEPVGKYTLQNKAISGRSHTCSQFPHTKSIQD